MAATKSKYHHHYGPITDREQYYKEALDNTSHFNTRLTIERKLRLPFLDTHTGIAQNNCYIWMQKRHRGPGLLAGQLYTYPARRWRKKRRPPPEPSMSPPKQLEETDSGLQDSDLNLVGTIENALGVNTEEANSLIDSILNPSEKDSREDSLMKDLDSLSDIPDAGEIEDVDDMRSDDEDYELSLKKKKSSKKTKTQKRKTDNDMPTLMAEDKEKPFACTLCGRRYKNRPGLTYHMSHAHGGVEVSYDEKSQPSPLEPAIHQASRRTTTPGGLAAANNYCDFCLGDATENKKTGHSEELISCSDCGRSGHPSCLQFTTKMTTNVKKYRWQCIECKSCHLCGTSDNDDQLLFCDDCDRGYHMYCLNPPMSQPPDGSWICNLCEAEAQEEKMQQDTKPLQQQQQQQQHLHQQQQQPQQMTHHQQPHPAHLQPPQLKPAMH
ncbi:zinc finger protein ubi-d4-like [Ptychodera flava]|uniref:zinc finger protein ubi-d4-like n=1 Tax=Ptychodera flava TaxID=63121 RepID=UPI00396A20ED